MITRSQRLINLIFSPKHVTRAVLKRLPGPSYRVKLMWDALDRPSYYFGLHHACIEAHALGIPRISAIEFGVAGGNGLIALENAAAHISKATGVQVDVYGFDMGKGLPAPADYRDLPYVWSQGFFEMDEAKLRKRLRKAKLMIGDVLDTLPRFIKEHPAPIGFVSFDLDYYSSTANALRLFDVESDLLLPRVLCYFDDSVCDEFTYLSPYAGELLAIDEFNRDHPEKKISPIRGLSHFRIIPSIWNDEMFVMHSFAHPLYPKPAHPGQDIQLYLRDAR
jgi:hypothetical protein